MPSMNLSFMNFSYSYEFLLHVIYHSWNLLFREFILPSGQGISHSGNLSSPSGQGIYSYLYDLSSLRVGEFLIPSMNFSYPL